MSLTEITNATGLTMPTAHRIVKALQSNRFLTHDEFTTRYSLGPAVLQLAQVILRQTENLSSVAAPYLERLRELTGETVGLHAPRNGSRVCIAEFVGHHEIRMATGVGHSYPLYAGAAGKAILAFLPEPAIERVVGQPMKLVSNDKPISPAKVRSDLAKVRSLGYAISESETVAGANALAAPVFSTEGVIGSINITGPAMRWNRAALEAAVPELLSMADRLSQQFGYEASPR